MLEYLDDDAYLRFLALKDLNIKKALKSLDLVPLSKFALSKNTDFIDTIRFFDLNETLPNSYLKSIDRGSMHASLELRSPYLNKKLFKFMNKYDSSIFFKNENKYIQKLILKDFLPNHLINKYKKGFIAPTSYKNKIHFSKINTQNLWAI